MKDYRRLADILCALINVYGPVDYDELMGKMSDYFPEEYELFDPEETEYVMDLLLVKNQFYETEKGFSVYDDASLEVIDGIYGLSTLQYSAMEKRFHPSELLLFSSFLEMDGFKEYDNLKNCLFEAYGRSEKTEELLQLICAAAVMIQEEDVIAENINQTLLPIDEIMNALIGYYNALTASLPRGFLHGYSFKELETVVHDYGYFLNHEFRKINVPVRSLAYDSFSYKECLKLAREIKKTDLFEQVNSDHIIELYLNDSYVYVCLLGYYNGDRNIIIFKDRENMHYNRQFFLAEEGRYPDAGFRVDYLEIILDDEIRADRF